ncbi:MAG TPA: hypothetical protein VH143_24230 [Kofleriaceae bacterium]|nr:hypothetical protein [Kofleriaceae bacterium]
MRVVLGTMLVLVLASCDPPPPNYAQYRYANDPSQNPNPPPAYSNDPNAPPSTYPRPGPPQPPGPPPTAAGYTTTNVPPPSPNNGGAPPPMTGGYTTTVVPPAPPPMAPPGPPPANYPAAPPMLAPGPESSSLANGQYTCFQVGMGGYVASSLVNVTLNPDSSYQVAGYNNAGGSYRTDSVSVYLNGGPLNGWIGAIGANAKGPLVRFRPDAPNNPGRDMHQGDQMCFLRF